MKQNQKTLILFVLGLFLSAFLAACGNEKPDPGPTLLLVDSESFPSINELLEGAGGCFVSADPPMEGGLFHASDSKKDTPEDSSAEAEPQIYTYIYSDLPEGGSTVEVYMRGLIDAKIGFLVVNASGSKTAAPDFSTPQGSLTLIRPNLEMRKNIWVTLTWDDTDLTITTSLRDATSGGAPGTGTGTGTGTESSPQPLTAEEGVNFLSALPTSVLGLPGDSMNQYQIYFTDGNAVVNGISCMRLRVYEICDAAGTNNFLATYLLSSDRSKLYRLDTGATEPTVLPLP